MRFAALCWLCRGLAVLPAVGAPSGGPTIPVPHPITMLLRAPSVVRELSLSREQAAVVAGFVEEAESPLWRLRDLPARERDQAAAPILELLRTRLRGVLASRQIDRLDQLVLRAQGMRIVLEPPVVDVLKLTNWQQERIRAILGSSAQNANPAEVQRSAQAVLSFSQQRSLASLHGPPFDLSSVRQVACAAPELDGVTEWIHSSPLTLRQLRGKVVVVHFYTFGCVNCIHNLPHYNAWFDRFRREDVAIVGIHRPETERERDIDLVRRKAGEAGIRYPVAVDNEARNWDAWANPTWPGVYLIDRNGFIRLWWYGELNWQQAQGESWMRTRITELIAEPAWNSDGQAKESPGPSVQNALGPAGELSQ
ncbi:MAG: redoxin domain-containing protein [Planctomycetes bacterium]|nr:redoxin domain-containing protein [Planctomycetota bacterium]